MMWSHYIIFDTSPTYRGGPLNRYQVVKGVELYNFFGDVVIMTLSGEEQLHNPIRCVSQLEAGRLCEKLNAKYVHDNEPETFLYPSWQEAYIKYYGKENNT